MEDDAKECIERAYELAVLCVNEADEPSFPVGIRVVQKEGPRSVPLAYPIKKHQSAFLRVYIIECAASAVRELAEGLNHSAAVIRHLLITPPIVTRRKQAVAREEAGADLAKVAAGLTPARPEAVSNEALEEALEKILENEPK